MSRRRHLQMAFADPRFRRLLLVRLSGQFGDGVFQAGLAGAVLFNPERQAHASDVAAGFAVLLLPYSLIGPFAGVLLDRWSRRRVLAVANACRTVGILGFAAGVAAGLSGIGFYAGALVLISIARFVLSALGASLPHVVPGSELVTANSLSSTAGALVTALGGGAAVGVRGLLLIGSGDEDYGSVTASAALLYALAAVAAAGFARDALGPDDDERAERESARDVLHGLVAGLRHVRARRSVYFGLLAITAHRLGYGITTVCTLLLYRNYYDSDGVFRAGLTGLTQVVAMIAVGGALAALVTPVAFRHVGPVVWPTVLLLGAAGVQAGLVLMFRLPATLLAALLLGFIAQAIKITVDTLVQREVADAFRGRVFAVYDMLFNVTLATAAVLTATVLPGNGRAPGSVIVIAAGYVLAAVVYGRRAGARAPVSPAPRATT